MNAAVLSRSYKDGVAWSWNGRDPHEPYLIWIFNTDPQRVFELLSRQWNA